MSDTNSIPGLLQPGNIDLNNRPRVRNSDGSISTVRSISINEDGQEVLIPTVVGGRVVSDEEAVAYYHRTGEFLGKFDNAAHATSYAQALHQQQAKLVGEFRPTPTPTPGGQFQPDKPIINIPVANPAIRQYGNPPAQQPGGGQPPAGGGQTAGGDDLSQLFNTAHPNEKDQAKYNGREALRQVLSDLGIRDELPTSLTDVEDTAQKILRWGQDLSDAQKALNSALQKGDPRKIGMQMRVLDQAQTDLADIKQQFSGFMSEYLHPQTGRPAITDDPGRVREREYIYNQTGRKMPITGEDWESMAKGLMKFDDDITNEKAKSRPDQLTLDALQQAKQFYSGKFQDYTNQIFGTGGRDMVKTPDGRYIDRGKLPGVKNNGSWPTDVKPGWFTEMGATDEPTAEDIKSGGPNLDPGQMQQEDAAAQAKADRARATAQAAFQQEGDSGGPAVDWIRRGGSLVPVGGVTTGALQVSRSNLRQ